MIFAASESCADLLYAVRLSIPDPFLWAEIRGRTYAMLSDLEIDRGRKKARVDTVVSLSDVERPLRKGTARPPAAAVIARFLAQRGVRAIDVPADFPHGLAAALARHGIRTHPADGPFFPERISKSPAEVASLLAAQRIAEAGMARAEEILRASRPTPAGRLSWTRRTLTSEILQGEINACIARLGAVASHTIVAGGVQACDPHEPGHGPLPARKPIIVDIFPRVAATGCWGDITRTFARGTAPDAARKLHATVLAAQRFALRQIRAGCDGQKLQSDVRQLFAAAGYPTRIHRGRQTGFFHGLGHGVGLEIHEPPRLADGPLPNGTVISVEPGLYYPGIGGVRIEDVVAVTSDGLHNLTHYPKHFEI